MSGFELSALDPVFRAIKLADLDVVLVGGHAVSFYTVKYADRCPELLRYFPLLSKDADLIGERRIEARSSLKAGVAEEPTERRNAGTITGPNQSARADRSKTGDSWEDTGS